MCSRMRLITEAEVRQHLTVKDAIEPVYQAFESQALRRTTLLPRHTIQTEAGQFFRVMAAYDPDLGTAGAKLAVVNPATHSASVVLALFDVSTNRLVALMEADWLGQVRTAGATAVATRLLAREDSRTLALLGTGKHAEPQLQAVLAVRNIEEVRVFSPTSQHVEEFVRRVEAGNPGLRMRAAPTPRQALDGADVIVTITRATTPVFRHDWVGPGCHINAVGSNRPDAREVSGETVRRSIVFADSLDQAWNESGNLVIASYEDAVRRSDLRGDLADLIAGRVPGRRSRYDTTLYISTGLATQDLAVAKYVAQQIGA